MTVYHQVLKTAYRKIGRFFMPGEKCLSSQDLVAPLWREGLLICATRLASLQSISIPQAHGWSDTCL